MQRRIKPVTGRQEVHAGKATVQTSVSDKKVSKEPYYTDDQEIELLRQTFSEEEPPAYVKVSTGMTVNLHNFEFLRVDISVSIPTAPDRLEEAYQTAADFCAEKVAAEQKHWLGVDTGKQRGKGG